MRLVRGISGICFRGSEACVYGMGEGRLLKDGVYGSNV